MFFKKRKQKLLEEMLQGIDMVKMGTYRRLAEKFKIQYGDRAKQLAATITNELFNCENEISKEFIETYSREVEEEIGKLISDIELRSAVTQAVRVMATLEYSKGDPEVGIVAIEKLNSRQILVPGGDAPQPVDFLEMAGDYLVQTENYDI